MSPFQMQNAVENAEPWNMDWLWEYAKVGYVGRRKGSLLFKASYI